MAEATQKPQKTDNKNQINACTPACRSGYFAPIDLPYNIE